MLAKCMNWSVCSKLLCGGQKLWTDVVHMCPGWRSSMSKKLRAYIRSHGRLCPGLAREAGRAPLHPPRLPPSQRLPTGSHSSSPSRTLLWQPTLLRSKSAIYILKLLCRSAKRLNKWWWLYATKIQLIMKYSSYNSFTSSTCIPVWNARYWRTWEASQVSAAWRQQIGDFTFVCQKSW